MKVISKELLLLKVLQLTGGGLGLKAHAVIVINKELQELKIILLCLTDNQQERISPFQRLSTKYPREHC